MTTKRTRVSDICAWQEYVDRIRVAALSLTGQRIRTYPIDAERHQNLVTKLIERPDNGGSTTREGALRTSSGIEQFVDAVDGDPG